MTHIFITHQQTIRRVIPLILIVLVVTAVGAQDVAQEVVDGIESTNIELVNPFNNSVINLTLMRLLYIVGGVGLLLVGWRFFKLALGIVGFALGSSFGAGIASAYGAGPLVVILSSLLFGIIASLLATFAYFAAVGFIGAYVGFLLTGQVLTALAITPTSFLPYIIGAVVGGIVAVLLAFELTVILSSFVGAFMVVIGLGMPPTITTAGILLVMCLAGVIIQIWMVNRFGDGEWRRRGYA